MPLATARLLFSCPLGLRDRNGDHGIAAIDRGAQSQSAKNSPADAIWLPATLLHSRKHGINRVSPAICLGRTGPLRIQDDLRERPTSSVGETETSAHASPAVASARPVVAGLCRYGRRGAVCRERRFYRKRKPDRVRPEVAMLAADGAASKRRWLSLCRPSRRRAGRPAGFRDGRTAVLSWRVRGLLHLPGRAEAELPAEGQPLSPRRSCAGVRSSARWRAGSRIESSPGGLWVRSRQFLSQIGCPCRAAAPSLRCDGPRCAHGRGVACRSRGGRYGAG